MIWSIWITPLIRQFYLSHPDRDSYPQCLARPVRINIGRDFYSDLDIWGEVAKLKKEYLDILDDVFLKRTLLMLIQEVWSSPRVSDTQSAPFRKSASSSEIHLSRESVIVAPQLAKQACVAASMKSGEHSLNPVKLCWWLLQFYNSGEQHNLFDIGFIFWARWWY